jgi:thiamine kinase-like enzyme
MLNVPGKLSDLSREWLQEALGVAVQDCRVVDANSGTTGRAVLEIDAPEEANLPARLFVKLPPTDEMQRAFVTATGMGKTEAQFYSSLSSEVPVRVPTCYYAASDEAGESYVMLLEHLEDSGCSFQNASTRYSLDYVRSVLAQFAKLHASYWQTPRFSADLDWVQPPVRHEIAEHLIEQAMQQHAQTMPPIFREMAELFLGHTDGFFRIWGEGDHTVIHGDAHDANLFFDNGRPGFLDWAIVSKAPGMRDVGYFLAGTLTQEHLPMARGLLGEYRDLLLAQGVPAPSLDALWQQFQWHAAYVWVGATVTLAMGDAWQPVSYVMSALERLHGTLEYIGSAQAIRSAV